MARRCASSGDCFILGRPCAPFRLAAPFLLLLLQCAWSSRYNPAKGQPGRHKKSSYSFEATSYEDVDDMEDDMDVGLGRQCHFSVLQIEIGIERSETEKRRKKLNRTEMNSGRANWPSSWLPAGQEQEQHERICCCCWWHNWRLFPGQMPSGSDASP